MPPHFEATACFPRHRDACHQLQGVEDLSACLRRELLSELWEVAC